MAARKTMAVQDMREFVNAILASPSPLYRPEDYTPEQAFRAGAIAALEHALHAAGNYRGFGFTPSEVDQDTYKLREGHDDTRRIYF